jgi:hypothetical protein
VGALVVASEVEPEEVVVPVSVGVQEVELAAALEVARVVVEALEVVPEVVVVVVQEEDLVEEPEVAVDSEEAKVGEEVLVAGINS